MGAPEPESIVTIGRLIDIGRRSPAFPVTPPYVRITYTAVRRIEWKSYLLTSYGSPATGASPLRVPAAGSSPGAAWPRGSASCLTDAFPRLDMKRLLPSTVRAFGHTRCGSAYPLPRLSALGCLPSLACLGPTLPSADFCRPVRAAPAPLSPSRDSRQISQGKAQNVSRVGAGLIKHTPWRMADCTVTCPLVPGGPTPHIRFLGVAPRVGIGLPPDPTSR